MRAPSFAIDVTLFLALVEAARCNLGSRVCYLKNLASNNDQFPTAKFEGEILSSLNLSLLKSAKPVMSYSLAAPMTAAKFMGHC